MRDDIATEPPSTQLEPTTSGDNNYSDTTGPRCMTSYQSKQPPRSRLLASAPNSSVVNQPVTITATITGAKGGTPTGTVAFADNGTTITTGSGQDCSAVKLVAQQTGSAAQCVTTTLSLGNTPQHHCHLQRATAISPAQCNTPPAQDVTRAHHDDGAFPDGSVSCKPTSYLHGDRDGEVFQGGRCPLAQ